MKTSIIIQNLKCGGCANTITSKITALENISDVTVDQENSIVSFTATSEEDALKAKDKLKSLGYPSIEEGNNTFVKAKSFVSCATGKMKG
ncbi:heavy-metal-associated domain-containing protein [Nonlabens mediterrranea]|uniref:Heavy-metal-associated domain-containing protein n=1 Tax=Nonlabens mediterrranea TaxID=1419947 RepID=A0ABS0A4V6_9FLAO|nr:heavy-metal-associated domain-containing protein [Nonlabens mediterrranea]MBF4985455.1 heavy-metal-associated domain-containing protein [Nonlabens mediterrranea]